MVHDWDKWKEENPDWTRDYSDPSTCPASGEVGEWRDKLRKKAPVVGMKFSRKLREIMQVITSET